MAYNVSTRDEDLANRVILLIGRAYVVDDTKTGKRGVYQFLGLDELDISRLKGLFSNCPEGFEIKDVEEDRVIWPSESGLEIDKVLDVL